MEWVAGFYISEDKKYVALVKKEQPPWQKGKLNAIGGKVEDGELPVHAMHREFQEETGLSVLDWNFYCRLDTRNGSVFFYHAYGDPFRCRRKNDVGEEIMIIPVDVITEGPLEVQCQFPYIANLAWLLQMAFSMRRESAMSFIIKEGY